MHPVGARPNFREVELARAVEHACLEAANAMGPRIKGMSCFLHNWRSFAKGVGEN